MDSIQAHKILNEVKEGVWHSHNDIVRALVTTGDIHDKFSSPYNIPSNRFSPNDSPFAHPAGLQVLEGEPR